MERCVLDFDEVVPVHVGGNGVALTVRHGQVLLITLNRAAVLNAVNADLTIGVGEALDYAEV